MLRCGFSRHLKPPEFGTVAVIALELVVCAFNVSAVIANIPPVKVCDHRQETLAIYAVAATGLVNRVPIRFHFHAAVRDADEY